MRSKIIALLAFGMMAASPAHAAVLAYSTTLSGAAESPPNASLGTGTASATFDTVTNFLTVNVSFSGLTGTTTASHIHCCTTVAGTGTAGVATETPTFGGFPLGVTSGNYTNVYDMTLLPSYNAPFVTANGGSASGALAALLAGLNSGKAYLNVHSSFAPGGEIRGFLLPVPEPASWAMMLAGFGFIGGAMRLGRRRGYKAKFA